MAVTAKMYGQALLKALNKEINWASDTIKVALVTNAYTPDQDAHTYWTSVVGNEIANGNGYTTGGATLASKTNTYTGATNIIALGAANTSWTTATITARYAVIYDSTPGSSATDPLLGYVDFGADMSSSAGTFLITWDAAGIFQITIA